MLASYRSKLQQAELSQEEIADHFETLKAGLAGYTYFEEE